MDVCDLMEKKHISGVAEGFPCDLRRYTLAFDGWNNFHVACGGTCPELKRSILSERRQRLCGDWRAAFQAKAFANL